jgi:hypothetical protein
MPTAEGAEIEDTKRAFVESRDVGRIIRGFPDCDAGNPRELKRMANLVRFYLTLRDARRRDPAWQRPCLDTYARWIALALRWPDVLRWLQRGTDASRLSLAAMQGFGKARWL